ncbi:MAG: DNA-formamidopyrimidine glycosylase [Candidatus Paceibacterota bacterium]|jgi:formamidopyrimidine-DNA glycosylase
MPELPEVQTTVSGLKKVLPKLKINDFWSDLPQKNHKQKETIKNASYFNFFKKEIVGKKIIDVKRKAKNILIFLDNNKTILIHMKMTGHLLYGNYEKTKDSWKPKEKGPLQDPYNRFIHAVFILSGKKHLAFSDTRKFGKITLLDSNKLEESKDLKNLGPEPLEKNFTFPKFLERINKKPNWKIKQALMDQSLISGIGNIYSDEILFFAGINPEERVTDIENKEFRKMFEGIKTILSKGIKFGGDSMSDYRNIDGKKGNFQYHHLAYQRTGEKCSKRGCIGVIIRKKVGGRSAHFCSCHQKLRVR